jgi:hypothetical protein
MRWDVQYNEEYFRIRVDQIAMISVDDAYLARFYPHHIDKTRAKLKPDGMLERKLFVAALLIDINQWLVACPEQAV